MLCNHSPKVIRFLTSYVGCEGEILVRPMMMKSYDEVALSSFSVDLMVFPSMVQLGLSVGC